MTSFSEVKERSEEVETDFHYEGINMKQIIGQTNFLRDSMTVFSYQILLYEKEGTHACSARCYRMLKKHLSTRGIKYLL